MNSQVGPAGLSMMEWLELRGRPVPLKAFRDGGGAWTCGIGATEGVTENTVWTLPQARARFASDVERFANYVIGMLQHKPTTQTQFEALVSACYNAGPGSLANSPIIVAHRAGEYDLAASLWEHWHIKDELGNVEPGLITRRAIEAKFYMTGVWHAAAA